MTLAEARLVAEIKGHRLQAAAPQGRSAWTCTKCGKVAFVYVVETKEVVRGAAMVDICKGGKR